MYPFSFHSAHASWKFWFENSTGTSLIPLSSWFTNSGPRFWWWDSMWARYRSLRGKSDVQPITWHLILAFMCTVDIWRLRWFFAMYWLLQYWHWYFLMFECEFMWWLSSDWVKYLKNNHNLSSLACSHQLNNIFSHFIALFTLQRWRLMVM